MKTNDKKSIGKKIGQAIKKLRERKNMSQNVLKEDAGLSAGYLSKLENGEFDSPTMRQIFAITKALDITLRDLLEFAGVIENESSLEATYRAEGLTEDEIKHMQDTKEFFLLRKK